jgi:hypothetical protein
MTKLAALAAILTFSFTANAQPKAPPAAQRAMTCLARDFNLEAATVETRADGVHVRVSAEHAFLHVLRLDDPKDRAHRPFRNLRGATLDVVFPLAMCEQGKQPGILRCGSGPETVTATLTRESGKARPITMAFAGLQTSIVDTTTVDGTTRGFGVSLQWGGTTNNAASITMAFRSTDTCTVK